MAPNSAALPIRPQPTEGELSCLAVLRGAERPDLLREESLGMILSATAGRNPGKAALIWGGRTVSYGELDELSGRIGGALARRGAVPGLVY